MIITRRHRLHRWDTDNTDYTADTRIAMLRHGKHSWDTDKTAGTQFTQLIGHKFQRLNTDFT